MNIYQEVSVPKSKICSKCKISKELIHFHKNKTTKDGFQLYCKECRKTYYIDNIDTVNTYTANTKEHKIQYDSNYRKLNKEKVKEYQQNRQKINHSYYYTHNANRRATKLKATPKWSEFNLIQQMYIDCKRISEMTGVLHHVDHIIPLQSDIVCGLHCISNLQIITAFENLSKHNKYWPDMP